MTKLWIDVASDNATISKKELAEWLEITPKKLKSMINAGQIPEPRIGGIKSMWRVGEIRAWLLKDYARLESEKKIRLDVDTSESQKKAKETLREAGRNIMGRAIRERDIIRQQGGVVND